MKKQLLVVVILAAMIMPGAVQAAECKFETNKVDKFTKKRQVATKWLRLNGKISGNFDDDLGHIEELSVQGKVDGERAFLSFRVKIDSVSKFFAPNPQELRLATAVKPESPLVITLADDSNITLLADDFAYADVRVKIDDGVTLTDSVTVSHFTLNTDTAAALSAQLATRVQLQGIKTYFDIVLGKKSLNQVQKAVTCIQ